MIYTILTQGLIYSLLAVGCWLTFTLLKFPDLTVEGSFVLGATVGAVLIQNGVNPLLAVCIAGLAGTCAGLITAGLHIWGKIGDLLSSIITVTALYTVNMVVMGHRANISVARKGTIFNSFTLMDANLQKVLIALVIVAVICWGLNAFLKSRFGMLLRATGENSTFVTSLGGNINVCKAVGLAVSNALAGVCGCLIMQNQLFVDIGMSSGIIVLGFAVAMLGLVLARNFKLINGVIWIIVASVVYQAVIALALQINFHPNYLKAIMAVILAVILIMQRRRSYD